MGECPIDVHPQLENFNDYFVETWLADDAKIPVGIGNIYGEDQKRTNNNVEGWNSKCSKLVRKHHPNIFEFVDAIRKEQAATELKTQHDAAVQPARKKKKYIVVNQRLAQFKQELKTQQDAAVQPARNKSKYIVVNQRLAQFKQELKTQQDAAVQPARTKKIAQFKQEYAKGERSLLRFLYAAGHLLKLE